MAKNTSRKVLHLLLLVSIFTLMRVSAPTRLDPENQASEHRITPIDQDIPVNDQDDTSSPGHYEGDDAMILKKSFVHSPCSILKQIVSRHMHPFREHHLEINTPPPKS